VRKKGKNNRTKGERMKKLLEMCAVGFSPVIAASSAAHYSV
jgi:hypothetical protein